ncbi:MAG: PAS domain-containing protein, partial [Vicinamibacteraceae bacterium]|nr:PAS domain-containing protein [Vicinamibacteraceae bacterium]
MRIFYVTADGSRVGVLERALARDASAPHHVEVATTAEAVVGRAGALEPVVVLVDGELPHTSPESAVASLRAHLPRARILVISEEPSAEHAGRLLLAGADEAILHTQLSDLPARLARHGAGADDPRRIIRLGIVTDDGELADAAANAAGAAATRLSVGAGGALTAPEGNLVDAVQFDVLVFDERRPHPETASVLHASRERVPPPAVVVLARAEDGASWLRLGACEVVHEADAARLVGALARAQQWRRTHLEQAQLRGKEARLRGLVESIPEGVLLSAPDGAILALNVAGLKLVGARGPRDVVGKKVADLVGDADRGVVSELLEAVVKGESRTTTLAVRRLDGSTAAIDVKAVPFQREPGRPAAMLAILREASARTAQAEEEWQEIPLAYDPAIESKLDELTRTLEEARSEVLASRERVDQLRNAHESEQAVWQGRFDELTAARDALAASLQALEAQQRDEAQRLASRLEA